MKIRKRERQREREREREREINRQGILGQNEIALLVEDG